VYTSLWELNKDIAIVGTKLGLTEISLHNLLGF